MSCSLLGGERRVARVPVHWLLHMFETYLQIPLVLYRVWTNASDYVREHVVIRHDVTFCGPYEA